MAYARMASRLKLFGLLLICTSVLVFLVLSACGVDSVHVNTPLAKRLATRWQLTSASAESPATEPPRAADTLLTAAPALASQPLYTTAPTGGHQVLPPGYAAEPYGTSGQYTAGGTRHPYTAEQYSTGQLVPGGQAGAVAGGSPYGSPATPAQLFAADNFEPSSIGAAAGMGGETVASAVEAADVSLRIPLWCINAVFLAIGFVMWSMPQPRPSAYTGGRRT